MAAAIGRPKFYEDRVTVPMIMERADVEHLDDLRGDVPRGRYVALLLQSPQDRISKVIDMEKRMTEAINESCSSSMALSMLVTQIERQQKTLSEMEAELKAKDAKIAELRNLPTDPVYLDRREHFFRNNIPLVTKFMANKMETDLMVSIQRDLGFPTVQKFKEYMMGCYNKLLDEGKVVRTPIVTPQKLKDVILNEEQQKYKDELESLSGEHRKYLRTIATELHPLVLAKKEGSLSEEDATRYERLIALQNEGMKKSREITHEMAIAEENHYSRAPGTSQVQLQVTEGSPGSKGKGSEPGIKESAVIDMTSESIESDKEGKEGIDNAPERTENILTTEDLFVMASPEAAAEARGKLQEIEAREAEGRKKNERDQASPR